MAWGMFVVLRAIPRALIDQIDDLPNHPCDAFVCLECGAVAWFVRDPLRLVADEVDAHTVAAEPFLPVPDSSAYRDPSVPRTTLRIDHVPDTVEALGRLTAIGGISVGRARALIRGALPYRVRFKSEREAMVALHKVTGEGWSAALE